jgi:hypothetical protein
VVLVALLALGTSVSRPRTVDGAFTVHGGEARLLVAPALAHGLRSGQHVVLREPGLLGSTVVGEATIADGRRTTVAQFASPAPIEGFGGSSQAVALPLHLDAWHGPSSGTAAVQLGRQSLLSAWQQTYLTGAWRLL